MKLKAIVLAAMAAGALSSAHAQTFSSQMTLNPFTGDTSELKLESRRYRTELAEEQHLVERNFVVPTQGMGAAGDGFSQSVHLENADLSETAQFSNRNMSVSSQLKGTDHTDQYKRDISTSTALRWTQGFELGAHSWFTISGQFSLSGEGILPGTSLVAEELHIQEGSSPGRYELQTRLMTNSTPYSPAAGGEFRGYFTNLSPLTSVTYSVGNNGMFSATFRNDSDFASQGWFGGELGASVPALKSPVPEPSMMLSLMLGLGVVGGVARKRKSQQAVTAA